MSENEAKKTISLWKNSNSEFIARVDWKTGKTQRLAYHANRVSALMALYTDWPKMAHAMNLIGALYVAENWVRNPRIRLMVVLNLKFMKRRGKITFPISV